jgi:hypothetical protein
MPQIIAIVYDSVMALERRYQPLLSRREFAWRYVRWISLAIIILTVSLVANLWLSFSRRNSMDRFAAQRVDDLGGMGPVDTLKTKAGKLFASFYALYSGLLLISLAGLMFTPLIHRFLHRFHLELDKPGAKTGKVRAGKATLDDD